MAHWQHGYMKIEGGKRLTYYRTGGDKPPLVLAHGVTDNGLCWAPIVYELMGDYDCIMMDAYGHGMSSRVSQAYVYDLARDLKEFIEALGLPQPGIIGHSMGAATAMQCAARFPDVMRFIILEDPPLIDDPAMMVTGEQMGQGAAAEQAMRLGERVATIHSNFPHRNPEEAIRMAVAREQVDMNFFTLPFMRDLNWRDLVSHIKCPILLITGRQERGAIVTQDIAQEMMQLAANGQHHNFDASHSIRRDQPDGYLEAVRAFMEQYV